jgi:hypothetical protein
VKKPLREFVDWLDAQGLKPEVVDQKNHVRIRLIHPTRPESSGSSARAICKEPKPMKANYQLQPLGDDLYGVWRNVPGYGHVAIGSITLAQGYSDSEALASCRRLWDEVKAVWRAR